MNRRAFVSALVPLARAAAQTDPWQQAAAICQRIQAPAFPARDFPITKYGAQPGAESTAAVRSAIEACTRAGGGRVVVPAGVFISGAIHLKSNVNLHVSEGATIRFSRDPRHYLPIVFTRWEGVECMNYSPFIYALEQENIAVTGKGILDGQADCEHWWPWKGRTECGWKKGDPSQQKARDLLIKMGESDTPVAERAFGEGSLLRPNFIQPYRCKNVLIEGVKIINSPMWEINPVLCRNVTVRGVEVLSHGPNNDGCDPECCSDVLIEDCLFDTGDDCIAIKSGRNRDGRRINVPCENLVIRNCVMKDGHGAVTIGSEVSGGVRYVFAESCRMESPHQDRILRIKTNSIRGGIIEHIYLRDLKATEAADSAIQVDFQYEEGDAGKFDPQVRDIQVRNLTCRKAKYAVNLRGYARSPIRDVLIQDCTFDNVAQPNVLEHTANVVFRNTRVNGQLLS